MKLDILLLLNAAYLYQLKNPNATDIETVQAITQDLEQLRTYMDSLDKTNIDGRPQSGGG